MNLSAHQGRLRSAVAFAIASVVAVAATVGPTAIGADDAASADPASRWVAIYGWVQAGERLENGGHWPLAVGCFIEAHRQAESLRTRHPDFETEMLAYRIPRLAERIEAGGEKLEPGDYEIMTKFLDFIDSLATGLDLRYASRFPEALDTLNAARILFDEIVYEKPEAYRDALATQHDLLHGSLVWLEGQINFRERLRPPVYAGSSGDLGTTEFVKAEDLPADGDTILASASLFPFSPSPARPLGAERVRRDETRDASDEKESEAEPGEDDSDAESGDSDDGGMKPFRMSTRQQTASAFLSGESGTASQ